MNLKPSEVLSQRQITRGLSLVIHEGLTAEAMTALTGGTFLVALAVQLGATNFQIGLLAALPTLTNVFQLAAIRLVQQYNNRRAIAVFCNVLARFPILIIGLLPLLFHAGTSINVLIFLLFFHYFFGSIAGASWNSWMKDLVPEKKLGSYFSHRTRLTQILNVVLSLVLALLLDYIKKTYPGKELITYAVMFLAGGVLGMIGTYLLSRTPEPRSFLEKENLARLFSRPLKDKNFRKLLVFQSFWTFALNLATPFFTVYMMNTMGLHLSYIIAFGIMSQLAGIFAVKLWGQYSDRYSNKTILKIAGPLYVLCVLTWSFVAMAPNHIAAVSLIAVINILSGVASSGVSLGLNNIGLKLAPKESAIVYISARNMIVAFVSALGPLLGGGLADYFTHRSFTWNIQWNGPKGVSVIHLFELHNWGFLFVIGGVLAFVSLRLLGGIKEEGEVAKGLAIAAMRTGFRTRIRENMKKETFLSLLTFPVSYPLALKKKFMNRLERKVVTMRRYNEMSAQRKRA